MNNYISKMQEVFEKYNAPFKFKETLHKNGHGITYEFFHGDKSVKTYIDEPDNFGGYVMKRIILDDEKDLFG